MSKDCPGSQEARIKALEVGQVALKELMGAKLEAVAFALEKAEVKVNERFSSHNEFREQINSERIEYVTWKVLRWIIATLIAFMGLAVAIVARLKP